MPWTSQTPTYETPEKVIAIWTDATYELPGRAPTRGFGGRVYFYNAKGEVVPVNGQLVVYAFDDSDPHAGADQPTRKYAFTAEQLTRYYSNSELGASYNIWIPWDNVGGDEKQIALFPVFIDESGKMVRGSFANNRLPGKRVLDEEERRGFYVSRKRRRGSQVISHQESGVRPAGYETEVAAEPADGEKKEPSLVTHTIRVPRSLSERMANGTLVTPGQPGLAAPAQRATSAPALRTPQWPAATPGRLVVSHSATAQQRNIAGRSWYVPTAPQPSAPQSHPGRLSRDTLDVTDRRFRAHTARRQREWTQSDCQRDSTSWAAGVYRRRSEPLDVGSVTGLGTSGFTVSSFRTAPIPGSSIARLSTTDRAWSDATVPVSTAVSPSIDTVT